MRVLLPSGRKTVSDEQFDAMISRAMDELPQQYITNMQNVAITMQDEPDAHQRETLKLRGDQLLLGLFEGVPRTHQTGNEAGLLPSKITLFKLPIMAVSHDEASFFEQVKRTLWHEIAHYYGLNHDDMHQRQAQR